MHRSTHVLSALLALSAPFAAQSTTPSRITKAETLEDTATGGGSDGSFVAAKVATLDGLGVGGDGAHTLDEHLLVSSLQPRLGLLRRLLETLR